MGLFGKKKKFGQLRTLTEEDIQQKLYGGIKPELHHPPKEPSEESGKYASSETTAVSTSEKQSARDDLFELPPSLPSEEQLRRAEYITPEMQANAAAGRAAAPLNPAAASRQGKADAGIRPPWQKSTQAKAPKKKSDFSLGKALKLGAQKTGVLLFLAGKALLGVVAFAFVLLFKFLQLIDLRRPEVRRALYWLAGFAILFSLFLGIHLLNVKREAAMKTAPRQRAQAPVLQVDEPESAPLQVRETQAEQSSEASSRPPERETSEPALAEQNPYVIQIATYTTPEDADRVVKDLQESKLPAFSKELSRPSGRVYYSVFLGRFPDYKDAQLQFEKFRRNEASRPFQDAFIRTLS